MQYKQIKVDSLLNKITNKDSLFLGNYIIDPYQNCEFGCLYCDSSFDKTIYVKTNALDILKKELKKSKKGTIIIGSVHDPYQKAEKEFRITRELLGIIKEHNYPCHILTKSNLVLRDVDILSKINNSLVTISITSLKPQISKIFEKNVIKPIERLNTIEKLSGKDIKTGLAVLPILPYITDIELEKIVKSAKKHKAHYLVYKYLELKGDQKHIFMKILEDKYPNLVEKYKRLYKDSYKPSNSYILKINSIFKKMCNEYKLKNKI